jgi:hypothetical protein
MQGVCVCLSTEGKQNINQLSVLCSIGYHRCRSGEYSCTDFLLYKSPQTIFLEPEGCLQTPCFQMCRPPVHTKHEPVLLKGTKQIRNMHRRNRVQSHLYHVMCSSKYNILVMHAPTEKFVDIL